MISPIGPARGTRWIRALLLGGMLLAPHAGGAQGQAGDARGIVSQVLNSLPDSLRLRAMTARPAGADSAAAPAVAWDFDSAPPDPEPLRPADGIRDPVFAILVGQALYRHVGRCDAPKLTAAVRGVGRPSKLPLELLGSITRVPRTESVGVRVEFTRPLDLPVPYEILSYHPGSFRGSRVIEFDERDLGRLFIEHSDVVRRTFVYRTLELEDVRLYILTAGALAIDIDGWLDKLAGDKLDDTGVAGMVTFRLDGARYGMALGYNAKGEGRSGTIAFADDRLLYPNPPELKSVARSLRRTLETLVPRAPRP